MNIIEMKKKDYILFLSEDYISKSVCEILKLFSLKTEFMKQISVDRFIDQLNNSYEYVGYSIDNNKLIRKARVDKIKFEVIFANLDFPFVSKICKKLRTFPKLITTPIFHFSYFEDEYLTKKLDYNQLTVLLKNVMQPPTIREDDKLTFDKNYRECKIRHDLPKKVDIPIDSTNLSYQNFKRDLDDSNLEKYIDIIWRDNNKSDIDTFIELNKICGV